MGNALTFPFSLETISKSKLDSICLLSRSNFDMNGHFFILNDSTTIKIGLTQSYKLYSFTISKKDAEWTEHDAWRICYCLDYGFIYFTETHADFQTLKTYYLSSSSAFKNKQVVNSLVDSAISNFYHLDCR